MTKNFIGVLFSLLILFVIYAGFPDSIRSILLIIVAVVQMFIFALFETIRVKQEREREKELD